MNHKTAGRWRIKNDDLPSQQLADCHRQSLPDELGRGHSAMFQLDTDLNFIETHFQPNRDLAVLTRMDRPEPRLVVTLGIKGQSRFVDHQGHEIIFNEGYTSITAFHSSVGERQYQAQNAMAQVRFSLGKTWLDRYFGEKASARFFNKKSMRLLSHRPISNTALIATRQLLACDVDSSVKRLFMHGQAITILAAELSYLWQDNPESASTCHQKDQDIAQAARSILINEFKNPPSVSALSKRVGTNQFKLKQLFHHYFNTTPYGLLLAIRMDNAYRLLQTSGCQIDVAAEFVGYNHASNFSAAFSKYFGVSPSSIAKRHKS